MYVYTHTWCKIVRDRATREVRLVSGDIPSAAILRKHTVITNQVRDHTDTGSVKGVRRSNRGQRVASVTSIPSDHTVATGHGSQNTDHRTRLIQLQEMGRQGKPGWCQMITEGEPRSTHTPNLAQHSQATARL